MTALGEWLGFYEIVGSAAGALTGLQFVSMALIADVPLDDGAEQASNAFSTPSLVHFGMALLTAATVAMPWRNVGPAAVVIAVTACVGVAYSGMIGWLMARQTAYRPVGEDWFFRFWLPEAAYLGMGVCAALMPGATRGALFGLAAAVLLLMFNGIHHAWDNVLYLVMWARKRKR